MKCHRVMELVSDALDGVLEGGVAEAFQRHLEDCPPCRMFHAEMKESLLVLNELPTVEVTDDFDEAVWRRVRALEAPRSVRELVRERVAEYWSRIGGFPGLARWSPVGVAAGVLMMLAMPTAPTFEAPSARAESSPASAVRESNPAPESIGPLAAGPRNQVRETSHERSRESADRPESYEVVAGMPEAIEAFLESARDLRLQTDSDRYRRSNYSYPLRRVRAPSRVGQRVSSRPVSVNAPTAEPEFTVISF